MTWSHSFTKDDECIFFIFYFSLYIFTTFIVHVYCKYIINPSQICLLSFSNWWKMNAFASLVYTSDYHSSAKWVNCYNSTTRGKQTTLKWKTHWFNSNNYCVSLNLTHHIQSTVVEQYRQTQVKHETKKAWHNIYRDKRHDIPLNGKAYQLSFCSCLM